jgi:transposase-like protein
LIWFAAGKPVREVARLLEVSDQSIYSWRRQQLVDRGELPGLTSEEREELREARRRIGDCYDNAMIEAFWSRMQVELLDTRRWRAGRTRERDL